MRRRRSRARRACCSIGARPFLGGRKEKYSGTLGNYNLTAGSSTPRWRANVTQTVVGQDAYSLSGTVNYVAGYNLSAEDQGGVRTHARHVATR